MMKYGVMTAQRGWVQSEQVINALPLKDLLGFLKRKG
jgi:histidinol phosphatase-like PHP family hydrolase